MSSCAQCETIEVALDAVARDQRDVVVLVEANLPKQNVQPERWVTLMLDVGQLSWSRTGLCWVVEKRLHLPPKRVLKVSASDPGAVRVWLRPSLEVCCG